MELKSFEEWLVENGRKPTEPNHMAQAMKDYLEWVFKHSSNIKEKIPTRITKPFEEETMTADLDWSVDRIEMTYYSNMALRLSREARKPQPARKYALDKDFFPAEGQMVLIWVESNLLLAKAVYEPIFGGQRVLSAFLSMAQSHFHWSEVTGWCPIEKE